MKVSELIAQLQSMPQDELVIMVTPFRDSVVHWVLDSVEHSDNMPAYDPRVEIVLLLTNTSFMPDML